MASENTEGVVALPPEPPALNEGNRKRMQQARWLLLVMAALAIVTGIYFYVVNDRRVEADLLAAEISW